MTGDAMKENTRNWSDMGASIFFMFIGIGIIMGSIKLNLGTPTRPQPGLFPFLGGVFVVVTSSILMVKSWLGHGKKVKFFGEVRRPAILAAGMAVYVAVLNPLGYVLATTFMGVILMWVLGSRSWRVLAVTSVGMSVGTYLLFVQLLGVELPAGLLEGIWIY
jgi:hypothetical protein